MSDLNVLRRIAREAANTYVGAHWPSMETLRHNGIGVDFIEKREKDAAIRRFLSTYSPDVILGLLDRIAELEAVVTALDVNPARPWDHPYVADAEGRCLHCGWQGSYAHTEDFYKKWVWPARSSSKVETGVEK